MLPGRNDRLAIALLCALITLLFADVLFGRVLYLRDLTRYYHPTKKVVAEVIRGGEFPYWDPYHGAGQPLAANAQYEVFYPPQWLVLLPDFELGFSLHILLHLYVAAIGMYLMLRGWRLGVAASLFGAISFAIGGPLLSLVNVAYQGVVVPAGEHVVEFRYRNPLVAVGLGVTTLALLLALVVLAIDYPRVSWHR